MVLGALALASPAAAQLPELKLSGEPVQLTADSVEYESARELYVARGSARIVQGDRILRADWMAFSNTTGRGVASGHVVLQDGPETIYTRFIEFNIDTLQGVMFDARFDSEQNQFRLEGAEIAKTGERTYSFEKGMFTTCRCPDGGRDPWRIQAEEADLEVEGYAVVKNTTFEILGVPVVWLPWMIYPLKTERQTGLLFPELGISTRNGGSYGLPFFWAVRDDVNVLLTPRWSDKRGFGGEGRLEYVLGRESEGYVHGSFLKDESIDPGSVDEPFDDERWLLGGRHDLFLPGGVRFKADAAFVSDNQYVVDFSDRSRSDRFLESVAFATGGVERFGLVAGAYFADDLQSPDDLDRDRFLLQRWPQLELTALPEPLPWISALVPSLDVQYTYFAPRRGAADELDSAVGTTEVVGANLFIDTGIDALPDDRERDPDTGAPLFGGSSDNFAFGGPEGNGVFDEGEPLADRGHRVVLAPRLGVPFQLGPVEVYPEAGWHETLYQTRAQGFEERGFATARVDLRTRLRRRFGDGVSHLLEPRVGYALVTDVSQSSNPLFVPPTAVPQERVRQLALDNFVRDPADRIEEFNGITLGFGNRFYGDAAGGAPRLLADVVFSGGYDFADSELVNLYVDGRAYPTRQTSARFNLGFDPEAGRFDEALAELSWRDDVGHRVSLSYRYLRDIPRFFEDFQFSKDFDKFESGFDRVNQGRLSLGSPIPFLPRFSASYSVAYSFEDALLLTNRGRIEYVSRCRCYAVGVEVRHDRVRNFDFRLVYRLVGLGRDGAFRDLGDFGFLDGP